MSAIVDYLGLDVHKESIAVSIAPQNSAHAFGLRWQVGRDTALGRTFQE